jgi:hypothetical protein
VFREGGTERVDLPGGGEEEAVYHAPLWEMIATPRIHQSAWLER